jgi:amino acid transporter
MTATDAGPGEGLRRDVGFFGLLWISAGTTLGSGWLFGAFVAVTIAGPAALLAWVIAAALMAPMALIYAELGAMFPESGGPGRIVHHALGSLAGATFGWFSYVQATTIAPIEVLAAIEYLSTNSWASGLYHPATGTLSPSGIAVAVGLLLVFVTLNLMGIRLLARANAAVTVFKLAIPALAAVALMVGVCTPRTSAQAVASSSTAGRDPRTPCSAPSRPEGSRSPSWASREPSRSGARVQTPNATFRGR